MSDLVEMADAVARALGEPVRTGFDTANPGMPPALKLRHYPPHPAVDTPKRANCDCCDERPGVRTMIVCGIETNVCGPCSGDDENAYDDQRVYDPRERSFEEVMEDQTGKPAFGPL